MEQPVDRDVKDELAALYGAAPKYAYNGDVRMGAEWQEIVQ